MPVRSRRLVGPQLLDAGATVLYGPEVGVTETLFKSLRLVNVTTEPATFDLCIGEVDPANAVYWRCVVPGRSLISDGEWWVLAPAEVLTINVDEADAITVTASGAKLV